MIGMAGTGVLRRDVAADVQQGLTGTPKTLPAWLLYDEQGSRLYEAITLLPEYYLTRAERSIFAEHADDIVGRALGAANAPLGVVELGAGTAAKTEVLLRALLTRQRTCIYTPIDISSSAIEEAAVRLSVELPRVNVQPLIMSHGCAPSHLSGLPSPQLVMFIGSSVGNFDDLTAAKLLREFREALGPRTLLLLGTDLRKSPAELLPAYDDARGVTAAFNKNVLTRINRELGGHFVPDRFRHVARWNEAASRVEMHLESIGQQEVAIDGLALRVRFDAYETIHTESSIKYDAARVRSLLAAAGFVAEATYYDRERRFGVHLARLLGHVAAHVERLVAGAFRVMTRTA